MSEPGGCDLRELNERRSVALHRMVGERLREDPALIARARQRIDRWLAEGAIHATYGAAWRQLLSGPLEGLMNALADSGERGRALRQCSPFAGVIDARERWQVWRRVRDGG